MSGHATIAAYMGAKSRLAPVYAAMMVYQDADRYVDLFGGVGNLIIQKPPHQVEIYNDLDSDLCCLFRQLSTEATMDKLVQIMFTLPYSKAMQEHTKKALKSGYANSRLSETKYAAYVWYTLLASMNGNKNGGFRGINKRMDEVKFRDMIFRKLDILPRFDGVQVTNRNALDVIREDIKNKELADRTMYFLDSPYFDNKAGYSHNMVFSKEHKEYCELVGKLGGYKMVCGYDNPVYQEILVEKYGFYKYFVDDVAVSMRIGGGDVPKNRKEEYVWLNYKAKGAYEL